jgi:hypothetical protein
MPWLHRWQRSIVPGVKRAHCLLYKWRICQGTPLADMDMQIAATAKVHNLILITGNVVHFERIPGLNICRVLSDARAGLRPPPSDI